MAKKKAKKTAKPLRWPGEWGPTGRYILHNGRWVLESDYMDEVNDGETQTQS